MCENINAKALLCEAVSKTIINSEIFILNFFWNGVPPKAGQFFMIKPQRSSVFLGRPISINEFDAEKGIVKFLIAIKGKGTLELSQMQAGDKALLIGPLGNSWADFLPENGKAALVGGSAGVAPLAAIIAEKPDYHFHFYAGFKNGFLSKEEENAVLGDAVYAKKLVVSAEDGRNAMFSGRIVDYLFNIKDYDVIFACGSMPMLKSVVQKCKAEGNTRCYISIESRMACGVGACLGCTVRTIKGNQSCCTDGPIFPAEDLLFNE